MCEREKEKKKEKEEGRKKRDRKERHSGAKVWAHQDVKVPKYTAAVPRQVRLWSAEGGPGNSNANISC